MLLTLAIVAFLINAAIVGSGIYLSSYLKKKAEHLATREEFKDLQRETAELTRTTKEIEAKISDDVWNRQRRWELKRDILLEMAKKISGAYDALSQVFAALQVEKTEEKTGNAPAESERPETLRAAEKWDDASTELDTTVGQVALVCNPELTTALRELARQMRMTFQNTMNEPAEYLKATHEYSERRQAIDAMIRKELGIDLPG